MPMMPSITWDQALAFRLRRQFLVPRAGTDPVRVLSRLIGVQDQVPAAARLAITTRLAPDAVPDSTAVTTSPELLRTWAMRGTLHLLTAADAADVLAVLSAARTWERGSWQRSFASAEMVRRLVELVGQALSGDPLSRDQLIDAISGQLPPAVTEALRSGWSTLLKPLAWQGVLCQGPRRGRTVTFTRPELAVPQWPGLSDPQEAGPRLVMAYLSGYGPATPEAFDQWLLRGSTPKARLRSWFSAVGSRITEVDVEGRRTMVPTELVEELLATPRTEAVRLLPGFDQYVLGPGTKDTTILPAGHRPLVSRAAGWISPVVLRAGRVVGVWELRENRAIVSLFPDSGKLPGDELDAERSALSTALGREIELSTGTVGDLAER